LAGSADGSFAVSFGRLADNCSFNANNLATASPGSTSSSTKRRRYVTTSEFLLVQSLLQAAKFYFNTPTHLVEPGGLLARNSAVSERSSVARLGPCRFVPVSTATATQVGPYPSRPSAKHRTKPSRLSPRNTSRQIRARVTLAPTRTRSCRCDPGCRPSGKPTKPASHKNRYISEPSRLTISITCSRSLDSTGPIATSTADAFPWP